MSSEVSKETHLKGTNPHPTAATNTLQVQHKKLQPIHYKYSTRNCNQYTTSTAQETATSTLQVQHKKLQQYTTSTAQETSYYALQHVRNSKKIIAYSVFVCP
jgi:hypothetical protein